jgi:predicted CopG family antitoxin
MRNFFEETYMNINFKRELINLISDISEYKGKLAVYKTQKTSISKVLVQIMDKRKKGHRFLLESTPKQLIQITDEYIYSDFGQIVPLI